MSTNIQSSEEYKSFRSAVTLKRIVVDVDDSRVWTVFDAGPRSIRTPLVCLPPCSGSAEVYFRQILYLSSAGYRVLALNYPIVWTIRDWCDSFTKLLDHLEINQVHLFGASLGGFLAQKYAEMESQRSRRVLSLILCNSFVDTSVFQQTQSVKSFWMLPAVVLRNTVMHSLSDFASRDSEINESVIFLQHTLSTMPQEELASRLTLNCISDYVQPHLLEHVPVTLIDVFDNNALTWKVREETYKCYPDAKRAHLKTGGNFPYISRSSEVNVYIQIHLMPFLNTDGSPADNQINSTACITRTLTASTASSTINTDDIESLQPQASSVF